MAGRSRTLNIEDFFSYVRRTVRELNREVQHSPDADTIDSAIFRAESLYLNLCRVETVVLDEQEQYRSLLSKVQRFLEALTRIHPQSESTSTQNESIFNVTLFHENNRHNRRVGRPRYDIPRERLEYFLGLNFKVTEIAEILGVNPSTVHQRMRSYDLSVRGSYSHISNEELDEKVREIVGQNKNLGYRSVRSRLDASDIKVPYERVRQSMLRLDAAAVALRFATTVRRRTYNVASANTLWHLDGNHKLIRWKFVVHGCIDGYSRLITYLTVATNNKAVTVLRAFEGAVRQYGLPSRIRCDQGVENAQVIDYMVQQRGQAHRPTLIGQSVHNQRIERCWGDVFQGCLCTFYEEFYRLEDIGALDTLNDVQMYALHFTYLPIIQRALTKFQNAYNRHPLTTERGRSPEQLFVRSIAFHGHLARPPTGVSDFLAQEDENLGIDDEGPVPDNILSSEVQLQDIRCPLPDNLSRQLKESINPLDICPNDNATEAYRQVLQFLSTNGY